MRGINHDVMFIPPQRSVSLYWVEKWLLLIDFVQVWCLLWIIVAPQLPQSWNSFTHPLLICNLDIFHLYFLRLDASNVLLTSKLGEGSVSRILLAAVPLGLAALCGFMLKVASRRVSLAHSKISAVEATETVNDRLERCRRSTARVSLSRMFAAEIEETDKTEPAWKLFLQDALHRMVILAVQARILLIVWLFAPICNAVFPVVFCEDQAEVCSETEVLFFRMVLGVLALAMAFFAIHYVGSHVEKHLVAQTDKHHEEYVQQKEIEYMLHVNNSWQNQMLWMFTSFKREWRRVYHRQSLMIVKLSLCLIVSLFGTDLFRTQYALAWVFRLVFPNGLRPSNKPSTEGDSARGGSGQNLSALDQLLANPIGLRMRTLLGCVVVFVFAAVSVIRLPFRQRSSNVLHAISWILLACISGLAFAIVSTSSTVGVLLPANLVPLLETLHALSIAGFVVVFFVGLIRTLLPNSACALVTAKANNLEALAEGQKDEDLRERQEEMKRVKRRLWIRHGVRMIDNALFKVATNIRLARNSLSAIWSRGSSCALDEDSALYPSFVDSPWPISFYEGRYFIVSYPQVLRALKRARNVIDRYLFADKTLVPLGILDSAHADLQQHLVTFLSLREKHASLSKEDERQTNPNMVADSALSNHQELNDALSQAERQLALFNKELGDIDEDSTDAEDEEDSDTLSEASVGSQISDDTTSEAGEASGVARGHRGLLALTGGMKSPKSQRRGTGSAGGMLKDARGEVSTRADGPEQGTDVAADCHRLEGVLREIRQGGPNKRVGVAFSSPDGPEKGGVCYTQANGRPSSSQEPLLEALVKKAGLVRDSVLAPSMWNASAEDGWRSLIENLDREAAVGAQRAAEVARKSAELDFECLALTNWCMADLSDVKTGHAESTAGLPSRRHRGGQRMRGVAEAGGAGLLKRQNGGLLGAIDDLLAEMEEEAGGEAISEAVGSSEGDSRDGGSLSTLDFERPMLPNTAGILEAFKAEDVSADFLSDVADDGEYKVEAAPAVELCSVSTKYGPAETTVDPSAPMQQGTHTADNKALDDADKAGDACYALVERESVKVLDEPTAAAQEDPEEADTRPALREGRKRRKKLLDNASFSHLPESARRAALEFKVRRLSTLSHLSERFRDLPVRRLFNEMHHRQSLNHAFRWILLEAFETLSGLRSEVAPVTCLPTSLPNGGEALMAVLATRCRQRDQDLSLMNPKKRRILTKLLAIQFLCGTTRRTEKRTDAMIEKMLRDFSLIFGD